MLYVGILESPYTDRRNELVLSFFAVAILGIFLALLVVVFVTSRITRPLDSLVFATEKSAADAPCGAVKDRFAGPAQQLTT